MGSSRNTLNRRSIFFSPISNEYPSRARAILRFTSADTRGVSITDSASAMFTDSVFAGPSNTLFHAASTPASTCFCREERSCIAIWRSASDTPGRGSIARAASSYEATASSSLDFTSASSDDTASSANDSAISGESVLARSSRNCGPDMSPRACSSANLLEIMEVLSESDIVESLAVLSISTPKSSWAT